MDINIVVLETLQRLVSQDSEILKEAEKKIAEWETEPGFYTLLNKMFRNESIDPSLRLMAILLFKNGVDKYWRPNAPNAISENEKAGLRESLLSNFHVREKQIATHLAVVIAKIARHDWPSTWTCLMERLVGGVKSEDSLAQQVALLCLHQTVKTLAGKRLMGDRRTFQDFSHVFFQVMLDLWLLHSEIFFVQIQNDHVEALRSLEKAYLSLKILEKLTIFGFKKPHESSDVNRFINILFVRAKNMLLIRTKLKGDLEALVSKYVVKSTNILLLLLDHHPLSFVEFISPSLEYAVYYAFTPEGESCLFERFLIQSFNLIKAILLCQEFKPSKVIEETKDPGSLRAHQYKQAFFNDNTLTAICKRMVTHYLLLTPRDLELWDADPESFASDEGGESWKYSLRPSTETLFVTLFHEYREALTPVILDLVLQNRQLVSPYDINAILLKDAVYNAVGSCSYDLYDEIQFDEWYVSTLRSELNVTENNYRIIRRRVAWLVGVWTGVKMSPDLYPMVYADMIRLLQEGEDMVVRLTAANTVRTVVDDFEFSLESFLEFLEPMFISLFTLLQQAQECDTKMKVLHVLYFIVERVGVAIEPYYNSFIRYLPLLWRETENHSMLRCAVVTTLVHLVRAIGKINESEDVSNFILSVISLSTDVRQDCHIYLLEDGLELWYSVLENVPHPIPGLIQLFNNMPPLLEQSGEYMRLCISVVSAYILLSPDEILQNYGEVLVKILSDMLTDMRSEGIILVMRLFELFIKVDTHKGCALLKPILPNIFEIIHQGEEFPMLMCSYLSILSRVLIGSKDTFVEAVTKVSEKISRNPDDILNQILNVWLKTMPLITQMEKKKLLALALCSLLISNFRFIFEKFNGIVTAITEVLNDITRQDEQGVFLDSLVYSLENDDLGSYDTEHEYRKRQLAMRDPVHTIVLQDFFRNQMSALQRDIGPEDFPKFVATVDLNVLPQTREYIAL